MKISILGKSKTRVAILGATIFIASLLLAIWLSYPAHPASYVWVMDLGQNLDQTRLIKMCTNGKHLWEMPFGQSGAIGYDPNENVIWAPELNDKDHIYYDQLVKINTEGNAIDRIQGYRSSVLAVDPNNGNIWTTRSAGSLGYSGIVKLAPNGKWLLGKVISPSWLIYTLGLNSHDGSIWIGGNRKLVHLSQDGEILYETEGVHFFSNGPHQIAVDPRNGEVWYTAGLILDKIVKMSSDGKILFTIDADQRGPIAIAIHPLDGNVWVANYNQRGTGSIRKISQGGEILFDIQTPQHAYSVGINPYDGIIWVGIESGIILLDQNGNLIDVLTGFNQPISFAFGQSKNQLEAIINCSIR
jgi:DNA-binding beta-propeller fold protein YncE